jgi:TPR repeat protein
LQKRKVATPEAQCWVGREYGEGRLVAKDAEEAARWFLKSAEQGYAPAQRFYGLMFARVNTRLEGPKLSA